MKIDDVLNEALAWFEAYRRLGFRPDDIRILISDMGDVGMEIVTQGLSFVGACGQCDASPNQLVELWTEKSKAWNETMTEAERNHIWKNSFPANHAGVLVEKMVGKGFKLPIARKIEWGTTKPLRN